MRAHLLAYPGIGVKRNLPKRSPLVEDRAEPTFSLTLPGVSLLSGHAPGGANRERCNGGKGVAREQQQGEKQGEKAIHSLDTLP